MLTAEKLIEIINKELNLGLDPLTVSRDAALKELGVDSLDFYGILTELEKITGKRVSDNDINRIININTIVEYFNK